MLYPFEKVTFYWIYLFLCLFFKYLKNWIGTWWHMTSVIHSTSGCLVITPNDKCTCNEGLFYFCSKFSVQNVVMENGLLLCLIDFLVQKKISPQVMKAGRLCQEKMRMNLNYGVIAVVLKKTKNYLFRKGMCNSEIYYFCVYCTRILCITWKCWWCY